MNNYGVSAEVYYNLGNAYYRTDNITKAVLNYERAHLLSPGDEDISFNLQFARSKTIDKITPESEMFFVTWWKALVNFTSVDCWAKTGIIAIIMALVLVLVYLFGSHIVLRKIGFFGGIFSIFSSLSSASSSFTRPAEISLESSLTSATIPRWEEESGT